MRVRFHLLVTLTIISLLGFGSQAAVARSLDILLTNDDGVGAPGLDTIRRHLEDAGHHVLTVVPGSNRSGSSGAITVRGTLAVKQLGPALYSVDGTPVDCVQIGLKLIGLTRPDIIISGINRGQNVGPGIAMSGTVGAAVSGSLEGFPSIAVSQMFDPSAPAVGAEGYEAAARAVVMLVGRLAQQGNLPRGLLLNVNYPLTGRSGEDVWEITRPAEAMRVKFGYSWRDAGAAAVNISARSDLTFPAGTDEAALDNGAVSVTPLASPSLSDEAGVVFLRQMLLEDVDRAENSK
jgi:5'-nucleotidase